MPVSDLKHLDDRLRLRLADLGPQLFEQFFLHFLRAGISLSVERHGSRITRRVISAELYAAGSGRNQKGIDIRAEVEGDGRKEIWVFQCKRHKTWTPSQTREAIEKASQYQAQHYFLVVACDPHEQVQDEIHKHANWTFWNLDTICAEFRLRVPPSKHAAILFFLSPEELKRFVPFTTEALMSPERFFERFLGPDKLFRHDWKLVGREHELQTLRGFITGTTKVQLLISKGGDGKSRLLYELCRTLAAEAPEVEVLCLNPHRGGDALSFAFTGTPERRLILVDDAHRTEQVPLSLLSLVRQDPASKIVLATRPQGVEAIAHKLYEAGLTHDLAPQLALARLQRADLEALAIEALGEERKEHALELVELTLDSPFLTVLTGELVRAGRLEWGGWTSHQEFRGHVFQEFEQKNLETIPEPDRHLASGLIRMLALLAPAVVAPGFAEKSSRCLGCSVFSLETQLIRLRQSELVAGRDDGLRIVPDLFADSLVYDTCHGPGKTPGFVRQVLVEFADRSAALVRNLSEATWIARANEVADETLLNAVLEPERRRFKASNFYARSEILRHWSGFSIYLPGESLQLAREAVALKSAPEAEAPLLIGSFRDYHSHAYVCEQIPALLKPVAKYHDQNRHPALDILWDLGQTKSWSILGANRNHPWAVIAEVIKFEPKKPVSVTLDALVWLEAKLRMSEPLHILEGATPVLRALISSCFEREVEFTWAEGRTIHFCRRAVSLANTQPIREKGREILAWVVEHGSPLAALDALSALQPPLQRVMVSDDCPAAEAEKARAEWRPERLKALAIYEQALMRHSSIAVRYEIRQALKREVSWEEDAQFEMECRRVLGKIPADLALDVAVTVLSQGAFEFEEKGVRRSSDQYDLLWRDKVRAIARQLAEAYPAADLLYDFLQPLARELVQAGNHLFASPLFETLAHIAPILAARLAERILDAGSDTHLAREWPALIENCLGIGVASPIGLFRKAVSSQAPGAIAAVVRFLASRARDGQVLDDEEKALLLEIAARSAPEAGLGLLQLIQWSTDANLPWAFQILEALPVREVAPRMLEHVLLALVPYRERTTAPPLAIVRHVLKQLVSAEDLDFHHHSREWNALVTTYPREIYELVRERIAYETSGNAPGGYSPVPSGFRGTLALSAIAKEPDYQAICDDLWTRVSDQSTPGAWAWVRLFQAVVFGDSALWPARMLEAIAKAGSQDALWWLPQLLRFEGSLIIFRFPEITRAFLNRARLLGGDQLYRKMCQELHSGCGPQTRSYTNGIPDKVTDYVEAEAGKAAEAHAQDELLGSFYRWIVEIEQKERVLHKLRSDAEMAALD
jgi:hypothetical protein